MRTKNVTVLPLVGKELDKAPGVIVRLIMRNEDYEKYPYQITQYHFGSETPEGEKVDLSAYPVMSVIDAYGVANQAYHHPKTVFEWQAVTRALMVYQDELNAVRKEGEPPVFVHTRSKIACEER